MNLEEVRARLAGLSSGNKGGGGGGSGKQWKPKDEHTIRCLPYPHGDEFMTIVKYHFDIGDSFPIACPANFGEECVICDFAADLKSWKDPKTGKDKAESLRKSDFEMFRKLQSKERYFVWVVERGKEDEGAKYWSCSWSTQKRLLEICADKDYNEGRSDGGGDAVLTSPTEGHDLEISYQKPGEKGNKTTFTLTKVNERKRPSRLHDDKKKAKDILDSVQKLEDVIERKTSKEVEILWKKYLNSGEKTAENKAGGDTPATEKYESKNAEKPQIGGRSVDDALADLVASS